MSDVRQWLTILNLERFADAFESEEVAFEHLSDLTDTDLKDLGLPLGPRKTILKATAELAQSAEIIKQELPEEPIPKRGQVPEPITGQFPSGERRQLTVMFCDLVGSTALTGC